MGGGPIPGVTDLGAAEVEELYRRLHEAARRVGDAEKLARARSAASTVTKLRPVGGLTPASVGRGAIGGLSVPSLISGGVLGAVGGAAISGTESAADALNKDLDEYSPTEALDPFRATAAYLGIPGVAGARYKGPQAAAKPEPVTTRPASPTTAPQTPTPSAFVGPQQEGSQEDDWTPEDETYFRSLKDEVTGQPTSATAEPQSNGITAVKGPDGKITWVTRNLLGAEGGYDPHSEIGYQAGLNALAKRDLGEGEAALPNEGKAVLAAMRAGATPLSPPPPKDITQLENFNDFMDESEAGRLSNQLGRAQFNQSMQAAEIDPRKAADVELTERSARAHLLGSQGEESLASADFTRARAAILRSPEAEAIKQGRATAEETLAFRDRLTEQAMAEIDPAMIDAAAKYMVKEGLAADLATAKRVALQRMVKTKRQEIIADDPALQRYFIAQTGSLGGTSTGAPLSGEP